MKQPALLLLKVRKRVITLTLKIVRLFVAIRKKLGEINFNLKYVKLKEENEDKN
jgi:hypothetical protein